MSRMSTREILNISQTYRPPRPVTGIRSFILVSYTAAINQPALAKSIKIPWLLVRKRTIPTERPPLVSEIAKSIDSSNSDMSHNWLLVSVQVQTVLPTACAYRHKQCYHPLGQPAGLTLHLRHWGGCGERPFVNIHVYNRRWHSS
jgi:hypothetical protein